MQRCRVLVINDFVERGGAEVVYRQSAELLSAMPGVDVERFDESRFEARPSMLSNAWNFSAAHALRKTMRAYRPHRILLHNYHNLLSPSVLGEIQAYRREFGCLTAHTCHDYHLVSYNPAMHYYANGRAVTLPLEVLNTRRALFLAATDKGLLHDLLTKGYWHAIRAAYRPQRVFDSIICPCIFMEQALTRSGIDNTVVLFNPCTVQSLLTPRVVRDRDRFNLAYVGRITVEKGLAHFIELAQAADFAHIECLGVYGEGPDRKVLEQRYASLVERGKLVFFGNLPQDRLFAQLQRFADAIVVPSLAAENGTLVIVEAAMLGLPALVRAGGSLLTAASTVGNKIMFDSDPRSVAKALGELASHLADEERTYDVSEYRPDRYADRLAQILRIDGAPAPSSRLSQRGTAESSASRSIKISKRNYEHRYWK